MSRVLGRLGDAGPAPHARPTSASPRRWTPTADEWLHRARKAANRARYAAELTAPLRGGKKAKRATKHYKRIQRVLGQHQDAVVAADTLWHVATRAGAAGANGFTPGLLFAREQVRADLAVAALHQQ